MMTATRSQPLGALLQRAAQLLGAACGLRFCETNHDLLAQGLARAAAAQQTSIEALLDQLERPNADGLLQAVLRHVTIGETYLFRHPEHFAALREQVIPELVRDGETRSLRAWSAGCATGEEAWSLASTLYDAAGATHSVSVLGTDINRAALGIARRGRYSGWSVRGALPTAAHFVGGDGGSIAVSPTLCERVRFSYLNLRNPIYPSLFTGTQGMHVIFCRNVLLYFFADAAAEVLRRLSACLVEGGYLFVSALDVDPARPLPDMEEVRWGSLSLLRKRRSQPAAARPRRATPPAPPSVSVPAGGPQASPAATDAGAEAAIRYAKAVADRGDLPRALELARQAVAHARTPAALHLLALVLTETGDEAAAAPLLAEAVERAPDYVLGHLALGLIGPPQHLQRVLALTEGRRGDEMLAGPDPLPVSWVRTMAAAALRRQA
jgi:chemotaxis protein methyltransferase CheR